MSTCAIPRGSRRSARCSRACRASARCWTRTASASTGSTTPRRASSSLIAEPDAWFTYYYWEDDARAPDYARTVDIHRKPGYDPVELFLDPAIKVPPLAIGSRLVRKKLGFRTLLDVIPLDATLVKGSHGRIADDPAKGPLLMTRHADLLGDGEVAATDVHDVILRHLGVPVREVAAR